MPLVDVTAAGGVTTLTMDSPANRNALSADLVAELRAALATATRSEDAHVLVLTATGRTFCAGADLAEIRAERSWASAGQYARLLALLLDTAKPTVARVNGHVRGGGLGLVAACDLAVAPQDATFAFPEVRLGVAPAVIAPAVVPRLDPRSASRYLLTGATFDAAEAARIGLLTSAVPDTDAVDATVGEWVGDLRQGAPAAQAATKQILRDLGRRLPVEALPGMQALSEDLFASPEAQRRITAVMER